MKKILGIIFCVISALGVFAMHFYTVYWVYTFKGMLWAFISFCTPPFSEMIMCGVSISMLGWINWYLMTWFAFLFMFQIGQMLIKEKEVNEI